MTENLTPIRQQYLRIKRHISSYLVFSTGDFYETFDEDARLCAKELDIVLTSRSMVKVISSQWRNTLSRRGQLSVTADKSWL